MKKAVDIEAFLDEVVTLPSLPSTVIQITKLVNDPESSMADIAKAISGDPSISLKTLRLVNSAYYALPNKISLVDDALSMLGMKVIKNIVFTASVFDTLQCEEECLLKHNVAVGMAMQFMMESDQMDLSKFEHKDEAFIYGLLHDVGKIIFAQHLGDQMAKVANLCMNNPFTWSQAEKEILGVTHSEVGARLAEKWQLSPTLIATIAGHHDLNECTSLQHEVSAAIMGVADYIAYQAGYPCHPGITVTLDNSFWEVVGFDETAVGEVIQKVTDSADAINELVNL
jgi:HD-like signal output (HDOD) protein